MCCEIFRTWFTSSIFPFTVFQFPSFLLCFIPSGQFIDERDFCCSYTLNKWPPKIHSGCNLIHQSHSFWNKINAEFPKINKCVNRNVHSEQQLLSFTRWYQIYYFYLSVVENVNEFPTGCPHNSQKFCARAICFNLAPRESSAHHSWVLCCLDSWRSQWNQVCWKWHVAAAACSSWQTPQSTAVRLWCMAP